MPSPPDHPHDINARAIDALGEELADLRRTLRRTGVLSLPTASEDWREPVIVHPDNAAEPSEGDAVIADSLSAEEAAAAALASSTAAGVPGRPLAVLGPRPESMTTQHDMAPVKVEPHPSEAREVGARIELPPLRVEPQPEVFGGHARWEGEVRTTEQTLVEIAEAAPDAYQGGSVEKLWEALGHDGEAHLIPKSQQPAHPTVSAHYEASDTYRQAFYYIAPRLRRVPREDAPERLGNNWRIGQTAYLVSNEGPAFQAHQMAGLLAELERRGYPGARPLTIESEEVWVYVDAGEGEESEGDDVTCSADTCPECWGAPCICSEESDEGNHEPPAAEPCPHRVACEASEAGGGVEPDGVSSCIACPHRAAEPSEPKGVPGEALSAEDARLCIDRLLYREPNQPPLFARRAAYARGVAHLEALASGERAEPREHIGEAQYLEAVDTCRRLRAELATMTERAEEAEAELADLEEEHRCCAVEIGDMDPDDDLITCHMPERIAKLRERTALASEASLADLRAAVLVAFDPHAAPARVTDARRTLAAYALRGEA